MLEALSEAFSLLLTPGHFGHLTLGVALGLCVGVFPGLGGIVGLSLLLPFLYGMDTVSDVGITATRPISMASAETVSMP